MQHRSAMDPYAPKQFVDYICKQFQKAIDKRDRANRYKAKKLARLDPVLRLNQNYLKQFEPVKAISFCLNNLLGFKKEYKMVSKDSDIARLI